MKQDKLSDIQILRAIAILLVLAQHLSITPSLFSYLPIKPEMGFWIGVELFFVISGYVVTMSVFKSDQIITTSSFIIKRAFRLYPPILVFLLLSLITLVLIDILPVPEWGKINLGGSYQRFAKEAWSILLGVFINIAGPTQYSNGAMWSLSVEFQFYAFYAFLIFLVGIAKVNKKYAERFVFFVFALGFVFILLSRYGLFSGRSFNACLQYLSHRRFDFLCCGVIVYFIKYGFRKTIKKPVKRFYLAPIVLATPIFLALHSESAFSSNAKFLEKITLICSAVLFSILVYKSGNGLIFSRISNKLRKMLSWIGDRSYTIYLIHFPIMSLSWCLIALFCPFLFSKKAIVYGIVQMLLVIPPVFWLSQIIYLKIERPMITFGYQFSEWLVVFLQKTKHMFGRRSELDEKEI